MQPIYDLSEKWHHWMVRAQYIFGKCAEHKRADIVFSGAIIVETCIEYYNIQIKMRKIWINSTLHRKELQVVLEEC